MAPWVTPLPDISTFSYFLSLSSFVVIVGGILCSRIQQVLAISGWLHGVMCSREQCSLSEEPKETQNQLKSLYFKWTGAAFFPWRVYLFWLKQSNISIFCLTLCGLWFFFSVLLFNGEWWNCPGSSWSCSDCALCISRSEIGRGKQRPGGAASCQTALCMIEDNLELEHKHPSRLSPRTRPLLLHRQPWWTRGSQQLGQDGGKRDSFMTWQRYLKWYLYGTFKKRYWWGALRGRCLG